MPEGLPCPVSEKHPATPRTPKIPHGQVHPTARSFDPRPRTINEIQPASRGESTLLSVSEKHPGRTTGPPRTPKSCAQPGSPHSKKLRPSPSRNQQDSACTQCRSTPLSRLGKDSQSASRAAPRVPTPQKLFSRKSRAVPSTFARPARSGRIRANATAPSIVEIIVKNARSRSAFRRPGMNGSNRSR